MNLKDLTFLLVPSVVTVLPQPCDAKIQSDTRENIRVARPAPAPVPKEPAPKVLGDPHPVAP